MSHHVINLKVACKACKSTGLYVGRGERDGAAVVCNDCNGTGKEKFRYEYDDFKKRKNIKKVKRVYEVNPGIGIGKGDKYTLEDLGGMSYQDWAKGVSFSPGMENRKFTCPAWWYQSADYHKKPNWKECIGFGSFSECDQFKDKSNCWERWDKENKIV